ncbi:MULTISPECIES: putative phage tail protein [unclassified Brevibacillus]|uniref:putative phage tail protein n=1 Tax=unclassified Brevibacillus TaxID=2684853 RepID=UPI0035682BAF
MSKANEMLKRLQPHQRNSSTFRVIFEADATQLDKQEAKIIDLQQQLSVDTATWALDYYEKELGLAANKHKPISERRAAIKSKMRSQGKVSLALLQAILDAYTDGQGTVTYDGSLRFIIRKLDGLKLSDIRAAIEETKPAYIGVEFLLSPEAPTIFIKLRNASFQVDYFVCNTFYPNEIVVNAPTLPVFVVPGMPMFTATEG